MGCCTGRCFLIALCILQMVATIERQVFDFLGYMWAPIIGNFLHIIFIIVGFFGGVQYRPRVIIAYTVWCLVWIGWNTFVICFYLEVGILKRDSPILNLGTDNKSWWLLHGIGCQASNRTDTSDGSEARFTEEDVEGCLLQYYYVEIIHAGIQCLLSLAGFCVACYTVFVFTEEDDSCKYYYESFISGNSLSASDTITPMTLPSNHLPDRTRSHLGPPYHKRRVHTTSSEVDPLARSSFISLQERWHYPTYISFQECYDTWAGQVQQMETESTKL